MSLSNYSENKVLNHIFRHGQGSNGNFEDFDLYIGLATAVNTDASITEVANANAYARVEINDYTPADTKFAAAASGSITTNATITFAAASGGDWGTVTHIGIWDSGTYGGGNLIAWGALSVTKSITDGDTFFISSGNLTITLD